MKQSLQKTRFSARCRRSETMRCLSKPNQIRPYEVGIRLQRLHGLSLRQHQPITEADRQFRWERKS